MQVSFIHVQYVGFPSGQDLLIVRLLLETLLSECKDTHLAPGHILSRVQVNFAIVNLAIMKTLQ